MKKYLLTVILELVSSIYLFAQVPAPVRMPLAESVNPPAYAVPQTVVAVTVHALEETFTPGPYARYAQKYLGAAASLAEYHRFTITDASVRAIQPLGEDREHSRGNLPVAAHTKPAPGHGGDHHTTNVAIDRVSSIDKTSEEMARDAANTIFLLRKRRIDLITGEVGEYAYGEGMGAALKEINRLEEQYLQLFTGRRTLKPVKRTFHVVPEAGKTNYVVCRFSEEDGLRPATDLSGTPVALLLSPENTVGQVAAPKNTKGTIEYYRVADMVLCRVTEGSRELASDRLPLLQFGATVPTTAGR